MGMYCHRIGPKDGKELSVLLVGIPRIQPDPFFNINMPDLLLFLIIKTNKVRYYKAPIHPLCPTARSMPQQEHPTKKTRTKIGNKAQIVITYNPCTTCQRESLYSRSQIHVPSRQP